VQRFAQGSPPTVERPAPNAKPVWLPGGRTHAQSICRVTYRNWQPSSSYRLSNVQTGPRNASMLSRCDRQEPAIPPPTLQALLHEFSLLPVSLFGLLQIAMAHSPIVNSPTRTSIFLPPFFCPSLPSSLTRSAARFRLCSGKSRSSC